MADVKRAPGGVVEASGHPVGSGVVKPGYDPSLANEDLAPLGRQSWKSYNFFAFWMSDVHSVGGYVTAGSLFALGLAAWQVLIALLVGIVIVYLLCNLVARPSQATGTPYPVVSRVTFGVRGANVPAIIRGLIAVAWYGIQTYLASNSLVILALKLQPGWGPYAEVESHGFAGLSTLGWAAFGLMWVLQAVVFWRGMEAIRKFIDFCGPAVYVVMFLLMGWIIWKAGWDSLDLTLSDKVLTGTESFIAMGSAILLVVSYFAALLLNFGDFSRYARSERDMRVGNFLGLPVNFILFAVIVVIVTAGSAKVFGHMIMDPIEIVSKIDNKWAVVLGSVTFIIATMGINIVANFVSPAYDFANLFPRHIDFRRGGLITSVLAVAVCPWIFVDSPKAITVFVSVFGAVLAPLFGVMVADFYLLKKQVLKVEDLYTMAPGGRYHYDGGWNRVGVAALVLASVVSIGWELCTQLLKVLPENNFGWVIGAVAGAVLYVAMMRGARRT